MGKLPNAPKPCLAWGEENERDTVTWRPPLGRTAPLAALGRDQPPRFHRNGGEVRHTVPSPGVTSHETRHDSVKPGHLPHAPPQSSIYQSGDHCGTNQQAGRHLLLHDGRLLSSEDVFFRHLQVLEGRFLWSRFTLRLLKKACSLQPGTLFWQIPLAASPHPTRKRVLQWRVPGRSVARGPLKELSDSIGWTQITAEGTVESESPVNEHESPVDYATHRLAAKIILKRSTYTANGWFSRSRP